MDYRIENNILWVTGKLDSSSAADFEKALAKLSKSLTEEPPRAVLEFSGIETLTSAPLRAMLTLAKRLHAAQGEVVVAAPSPIALEALKVSGFLRLEVFQLIDSVDELNQVSPPVAEPAEAEAESTEAPTSPEASAPVPSLQSDAPAQPPPSEIELPPEVESAVGGQADRGASAGLLRRLRFWKR
jgi:anti-anti-sigma factor